MAINKVIYGGETLIDISDCTVTPETLAEGEVGYNAKGERIVGTMKPGESETLVLHGVNVTDNGGALTLEGMAVVNDEDGNLVTQCGGGVSLPTLTTPGVNSDILSGKQFIDGNGEIVTGTMSTQTLPTPSISVSTGGLITATDTLSTSGYIVNGAKSATKQLTTQAGKTITPNTSNQTAVASGRYTTGAVTVVGDSNLVADNIKSGVSIFGVNGSYEGSGGGSGGGSLDTCTLKIIDNLGYGSVSVSCQTFSDGVITHIFNNRLPSGESVFENVLCNSGITFAEASGGGAVSYVNLNGVGNVVGMVRIFTAPANIGETATITINVGGGGGW